MKQYNLKTDLVNKEVKKINGMWFIMKSNKIMYSIDRDGVEFTLKAGSPHKVYFNSPYASGDKKIDKAKGLIYNLKNTMNNKIMIFIHGFGSERNFERLKYYSKYFADQNYTVLMPILPFLMERRPEEVHPQNLFLKGSANDIEKRFYQAVTDILTFIDFLESLGYYEVNLMGYSFGGFISTIAMALDDRIKKAVLIVTGGNFEYIT